MNQLLLIGVGLAINFDSNLICEKWFYFWDQVEDH